ncbi:Hypothetical protein PACV_363 [Pacmanvirus A23]|uniref:Hypothetical protein n=1 Tax=Pacmanvirus A23 TaxID=1932881 RepID=UPI000A091EAA|nr:Hypothetical protein B9W72_gp359 [Pacmanvirus A23]SIP86076.1 Hypothetical protein PACV_363 [Pacmanvirus A23]
MTCPVVAAIKEIRGAGLYSDDDSQNMIKLGGSDAEVSMICDEMSFYIMVRKMDMARFELSKPNDVQCKLKYAKMFKNIAGRDYAAIYALLIDSVLKKKFMYNQFVELVNLIGKMEELIEIKVLEVGKAGKSINVTIPDIFLLPNIDMLIIYRPDILEATINKIIDYINKLNVNSLISTNVQTGVKLVEKFTADRPDMDTVVTKIENAYTVEEYLAKMKEILEHEMRVADYVRLVEKYQCTVINHLNSVYDICKKIINGLLD